MCMLLAIASAVSVTVSALGPTPPTSAPDGGASAILLGLGSLGLMGFRRLMKSR